MQTAFKQTVTIQEGGLIEVRSSELPVGARAEVIILLEDPAVDYSEEWTDADLSTPPRIRGQKSCRLRHWLRSRFFLLALG
jgi:hypothetical protein